MANRMQRAMGRALEVLMGTHEYSRGQHAVLDELRAAREEAEALGAVQRQVLVNQSLLLAAARVQLSVVEHEMTEESAGRSTTLRELMSEALDDTERLLGTPAQAG